jgi:hypothetical protein
MLVTASVVPSSPILVTLMKESLRFLQEPHNSSRKEIVEIKRINVPKERRKCRKRHSSQMPGDVTQVCTNAVSVLPPYFSERGRTVSERAVKDKRVFPL